MGEGIAPDDPRATLAHAINNPLAALVANLELALEALDGAPQEQDADAHMATARELLREARESAARIQAIVKQLVVARPHAARVGPDHGSRASNGGAARRRGRILVIDDELLIGNVLRRSLREYDVDVLGTATEALTRLTSGETFDVILCDLMMPEMTGMELYEELTRVAPQQAASVVFITGGALTARARQFVATVPNTVLEKPFDVHALRAVIAEHTAALHRRPLVFVVDDDEATRKLVVRWLVDADFECLEYASGQDAMEAVTANPERVDAIVLDVMMPGRDGFEVIETLKATPETADVPVILLTANAIADSDITRGVETGAAFYITKPFSGPVLVAQVRAACERSDADRDLRRRLHHAEEHATTDALTGLMNRRAFEQRLDEAIANATRYREPLSLVMLDLDHFKNINDTFGHEGGDRVLLYFARALRRAVRAGDHAFRYGGEEFAFLLPKCDADGALRVVTRIRTDLRERPVTLAADTTASVRFSAGVATADDKNAFRVEELVSRADAALYRAKREGRDRVVLG